MALSGHLTTLTNVRFWGQSGHDSNGSLCRLMTHSGHALPQSRDWRNLRGVTPIVRRKVAVRWLWLENPTA
jgi:hypothetical protein